MGPSVSFPPFLESPKSERVQIWVCLFLYGWYYPGVTLQILGVFDLCHFALLNGAVQIRVGLELAETLI